MRPRIEHLDARTLLSVSFANDPANPGKFIVQFGEDVAGTNDNLSLRLSGSQLEYRLNSSVYTNDLDSTTPGVQALSFSTVSRVNASLSSGNDALTLDASAGSVIPSIAGINYDGGAGTDSIILSQNSNFTLTDTSLTVSPRGIIALTSVERASLTGGNSANLIDASEFTAGSVTLSGQGQDDTLIGGSGNDELIGIQGSDVIDGRGGNDVLYSGNSGSTVYGGEGNDTLIGENAKDFLYGQGGNDLLVGANGADVLDGGTGDDTLDGGSANDTINGGAGTDVVRAIGSVSFVLTNSTLTGLGTDSLSSIEAALLTGGSNNNTLDCSGFSGNTTLDGGGGADVLIGGSGLNNFVNNQGGSTTILGGTSGNNINLTPSGFVSLTDSGGLDTINFATTGTGITLDLTLAFGTGQNVDGSGFTVALNGTFENVVGTSYTDSITGNGASNLIYGGLGADLINAGAGDDVIYGGTAAGAADADTSNDVIYGGLGTDLINAGAGDDVIYGGTAGGAVDADASNDVIYGGLGADQIDAGSGNDVIYGGTAAGAADADASNDVIYGGLGTDQIDAGAGDDVIYGGTAAGVADADASNDVIYGGLGADQIDAGVGNDVIYGGTAAGAADADASNDVIYGGLGADQVDAGAGNDVIYGGTAAGVADADASNDVIYGGLGADQVDAGAGNDVIYGGTAPGTADADSASDVIYGGLGTDQIDAGAGNDVIYGGTGGVINGTADADASSDVIYGGLGADQIDAGAGNDVIFGGTASPDADVVSGNDLIYGGAGNDILGGGTGDDNLAGGDGSDTYLFVGTALGSDSISESSNTGTDTLDFSGFGSAVTVDLAATTIQTISAGELLLTFSSDSGIENVIGSKYGDTILGNSRDNQLLGADQLDDRYNNPPTWNGVTQVVYLDFDSNSSLLIAEDHDYTGVERNAIQSRLEADYSSFHFQFTQSVPASGPYATLFFNKTPIVNGQPEPGGIADELDFRNLNLGGTAAIDVNVLLGGPGEPAATSANFVAFSATVAAHELGHLVGLRHLDSAGPIGYGIPALFPAGGFLPAYPGPTQAFETNLHLMASPASVGATLFDAVGDPFFGEREAIRLAFNESGTTIAEQSGAHSTRSTAQPITLSSLSVPNTLLSGFNFNKDFGFAATSVVGSVGLSGGASQDDYYSFTGRAGDLINMHVLSDSLTRVTNPIDSILRVYDSAGNLVSYYSATSVNDDEREGRDSVLVDFVLPSNGTYFIQVDTFFDTSIGVPDTDTGDYELFVFRFDVGNASDGGDYLDGRAGNDSLTAGQGNDTLVGGTGANVLNGGAGVDQLIETGDVSFALSNSSLTGPGASTLVDIEHASLTGGSGANTFNLGGWTGSAQVDGGAGADTLVGPNLANTWTLDGAGAGNINGTIVFTGLEVLTGGSAADSLAAPAVANTWNISAANAGSVAGYAFSSMEGLVGNTSDDTFVFANGAGVAGTINGGGGVNTLDHSARTTAVTVNLTTGVATGSAGISNIQHVFGGSANDSLTGNTAANILVGNGGNDTVFGNDGRDILVGGLGADSVDGGGDDDLLIGGRTSYDANRTALLAIMAEWTRTDLNYAGRIGHINGSSPGGLNGTFALNATTVFDDGRAVDNLWGRGGTDWFIYSTRDNLNDNVSGENTTKI